MTIPIATLLGVAAGAKALSGIAQGAGTARAGKKLLSEAEQEELADLERRRAEGGLGLTEQQEAGLRASQRSAAAGALQDQQAAALQQASAAGLGGGDMRSIFLSRLAQEEAALGAKQAENELVQQADQAARQEEQTRLAQLRALRSQAAQLRAQGIAQAFSGGLAGVGDVAMAAAGQSADLAKLTAAQGTLSDEELFRALFEDEDNPYLRAGAI